MSTHTLNRLRHPQPRRVATGPVLTPTQRPGLMAAIERALQRATRGLGGALL